MKKVIIATATLGGGGAERAFINIANQLVDMGIDVKIMASGSRNVAAYKINERYELIGLFLTKTIKL